MNCLIARSVSFAALVLVGTILAFMYWAKEPKVHEELGWPEEDKSFQIMRLIDASLARVESHYPPGTSVEKFTGGDRDFYQQQLIHREEILEHGTAFPVGAGTATHGECLGLTREP
jgi:hypothetical protein